MNITQDKIKSSALALETLLAKKKITQEQGTPVKFNQCLQLICQSLYSKPYEEIIKTLSDPLIVIEKTHSRVHILHYGNEEVITVDGDYVSSRCVGTDMEVSADAFASQAEHLAISKGVSVDRIYLPCILAEDYDSDDCIIALADRMGYFDYGTSLFDAIENLDGKVFIDDRYCEYGLNADWMDALEQVRDDSEGDEEEINDATVMYIETQHGMDMYEYAVSFDEMCKAKPINAQLTEWVIPQFPSHPDIRITLYSGS
jgi:hypothetical protein